MLIVLLAIVALIAWFVVARSRELFCLSVRDGRVLVVRGRLPGRFLGDVREIVAQPPVRRTTIRAVRLEHGSALIFSGDLDEGREQRLRNCFAMYPLSTLRSAPVVNDRSFGQLVGIAWLAWLLDRGR